MRITVHPLVLNFTGTPKYIHPVCRQIWENSTVVDEEAMALRPVPPPGTQVYYGERNQGKGKWGKSTRYCGIYWFSTLPVVLRNGHCAKKRARSTLLPAS